MRIADDVTAIKLALDKLHGVTPSGVSFSGLHGGKKNVTYDLPDIRLASAIKFLETIWLRKA